MKGSTGRTCQLKIEWISFYFKQLWVALHNLNLHLHTHNLSIGFDELCKHKQGNKCIYELFKFSAVPVIFFPSNLSVPHQETHQYAFWITRSFTALNMLYRWNVIDAFASDLFGSVWNTYFDINLCCSVYLWLIGFDCTVASHRVHHSLSLTCWQVFELFPSFSAVTSGLLNKSDKNIPIRIFILASFAVNT